jgi:hypothetical protein
MKDARLESRASFFSRARFRTSLNKRMIEINVVGAAGWDCQRGLEERQE